MFKINIKGKIKEKLILVTKFITNSKGKNKLSS
jgi:hypothetical protein